MKDYTREVAEGGGCVELIIVDELKRLILNIRAVGDERRTPAIHLYLIDEITDGP